jgi:hypothetical protein
MRATDSDRVLVAALDRLTEAVATLAARFPTEPREPDPTPAEPEIGRETAQEPSVDRRVVSLYPAPGWTSLVRVGSLGHTHTAVPALAVCRDGRVRVVVSDAEGNVQIVDGSSLGDEVMISVPTIQD